MFVTHRNYKSTLSREMIIEQIRSLTRQWDGIQSLPGQQPLETQSSFSFRITTSQHTISVKGVLSEEHNYRRLTITYRPLINPLYWYVPLCILFLAGLLTSKNFVINNEPVSHTKGMLGFALLLLLFSLGLALFITWCITDAREKVEVALQLKQTG